MVCVSFTNPNPLTHPYTHAHTYQMSWWARRQAVSSPCTSTTRSPSSPPSSKDSSSGSTWVIEVCRVTFRDQRGTEREVGWGVWLVWARRTEARDSSSGSTYTVHKPLEHRVRGMSLCGVDAGGAWVCWETEGWGLGTPRAAAPVPWIQRVGSGEGKECGGLVWVIVGA